MATYVLMDIEGVVCPFGDSSKSENVIISNNPWADWSSRPEVLEWVKELIESPKVSFIWTAIWMSESNLVNDFIGVKESHWIDYHDYENVNPEQVKNEPLKKFVTDHPEDTVIILDDVIDEDLLEWGLRQANVIMLKIDSSVGLTDNHITIVNKIISR